MPFLRIARPVSDSRIRLLVEAAGIEPEPSVNPNPMMAHDFGFYCLKSLKLPCRFESPGVLPNLGDILETQASARTSDSARYMYS
jgi:hypothetical protein